MKILKGHGWPGNVRELKNVLTKAVLESRGAVLLADAVQTAMGSSAIGPPVTVQLPSLDELEKKHILKAMADTKGNLSAAARILKVSRPTLRKRLKLYGIR
jgi:two-component system response regulator AtoC